MTAAGIKRQPRAGSTRVFVAVVLCCGQWSPTTSAQNTYGLPPTAPEPAYHGPVDVSPPQHIPPKVRALLKLGEEAQKMRTEDGGTLTPEHRAYLQQKLDAIQAGNY